MLNPNPQNTNQNKNDSKVQELDYSKLTIICQAATRDHASIKIPKDTLLVALKIPASDGNSFLTLDDIAKVSRYLDYEQFLQVVELENSDAYGKNVSGRIDIPDVYGTWNMWYI